MIVFGAFSQNSDAFLPTATVRVDRPLKSILFLQTGLFRGRFMEDRGRARSLEQVRKPTNVSPRGPKMKFGKPPQPGFAALPSPPRKTILHWEDVGGRRILMRHRDTADGWVTSRILGPSEFCGHGFFGEGTPVFFFSVKRSLHTNSPCIG